MDVIGTNDAFQRARKLRAEMTKPERLLWWALKGNQTGFHFRRQHAAGYRCTRAGWEARKENQFTNVSTTSTIKTPRHGFHPLRKCPPYYRYEPYEINSTCRYR